jgi:ABC-2 type transport system ATP-binding protein
MATAIETLGVGKLFRKRRSLLDMMVRPFRAPERMRALEEINFAVQRGEIFGLLGPNGAGKTTLLKILSSLVTPTEGAAIVNGHDVVARPQSVRSSIGLVTSDERSFYWRLSGRENLHFFAALANVPRERIRARCQELLEKVEVVEKADQPFMEYSTGTKQRLASARALLHDPPIIYMDEPTRSLDPTAAKHLRRFIGETLNRREGKTILLATHNLAEAELLCGRLAILHKSRIRRLGTVEEVRSEGSTRERYHLELTGIDAAALAGPEGGFRFRGCEVSLSAADGHATAGVDGERPARVDADLDRGGAALTELLRRLTASGARIISCTRREASLEEIFDLVAGEDGEAVERAMPGAPLASGPAGSAR